MSTMPVFAQLTGTGGMGGMETFPFLLLAMLGIFYFLVIRPQQQKSKDYEASLSKIRRGDTVITAGGFVAKVTKVEEGSDDMEVALNDQLKVRVLKSTLMSVRSKNEPVKEVT